MKERKTVGPKIDFKRLEKLAVVINDKLEHCHQVNIGLIDWKTCDGWRRELLLSLGWEQKWLPANHTDSKGQNVSAPERKVQREAKESE